MRDETVSASSRRGMRMDLPILRILRSQGDDALLEHELTPDEQRVFEVFDAATAELSDEADEFAYQRTVAELGTRFGLTPEQSVAFWTRTTFSMFEE